MTNLFIDIETLPTKNAGIQAEIRASIKPPGNIQKAESKAKWLEENLDAAYQEAYRKTALDGLYGEIFSIAWAFGDDEVRVVYQDDFFTEKDVLSAFFAELSDSEDKHGQRIGITKWVGHFITGFDLRFIWQRCVINKIKPSVTIPYDAKPWSDEVFDTLIAWKGASAQGGTGSLDKLCTVFGLSGKGEINGSNVYDYWLAGRYCEIAEYNKADVVACREIYKRMIFQKEILHE